MVRRITLCAVLAAAGAAASVPYAPITDGPPSGFTGGFGEPTCLECHIGNDLNAFGGRVSLAGLPDAYESGAEYPLTVILEAEETVSAGFQLTARYTGGASRGKDAGMLDPLDARVTLRDSVGVTYAQQSREGSTTVSTDGSSWTLVWTAPAGGAPVTINVAANSGNGDNSPLSDLVYALEVVVPPRR